MPPTSLAVRSRGFLLLFTTWLALQLPAWAITPIGTKVAEFDRVVQQMVADPARPRVYGTTSVNTVLVINTDTLTVEAEIPIGSSPRGLDISPDGTRLYVANTGSTIAGIGVIDLDTLTALPSLPTPSSVRQVVAGLNGRLYVVDDDPQYGKLQQLDAATGAVQSTFAGAGVSSQVFVYGGSLRLSPDRNTLYFGDTGLSPATLYRFDVSGNTPVYREETAFDTIGENGEEVVVSPDGSVVCYLCGGGNLSTGYGVSLVPSGNLAARAGYLDTDAYPSNGAFSPDGKFFYIAPDTQRMVKIFDTTTCVQTGSFPISTYDPGSLVVDHGGVYLFEAVNRDYTPAADTLRVYQIGYGAAPVITSANALTAHQGQQVSFQLTADRPVTWSHTALPAGVSLVASTGAFGGVPTTAGVYTFQVTATTLLGGQTTRTFTLDVQTPVKLTITGNGQVTGLPAGSSWQSIGAALDLTAVPDAFGAFLRWTGGNPSPSTATTLHAVVTANLQLTAVFAPLIPVVVSATGPGHLIPSSTLYLRPAGVSLAVTAVPDADAHFVGWSGSVTSTNPSLLVTVAAPSMDITATFAAGGPAQLSTTANGPGSIAAPNLGTTTRFVGEVVQLHAVPQPGGHFVSWSGDVTSTNPLLSLTMAGDTTLVANFDSLGAYPGTYQLIGETATSAAERASAALTLSAAGSFTGTLTLGARRFGLRGNLAAGGWDATFPASGAAPAVHLHLDLATVNGLRTITGTVTSGGVTQALKGLQNARFTARAPTAWVGSYTLLLPPDAANGFLLAWGYGTARITPTGAVAVTGMLGDGTAFSAGTALSEGDGARLNVTLPNGRGFVEGWIQFSHSAHTDLSGQLDWVRSASRQVSAFALAQPVTGSKVPAAGATSLSFTSGLATLSSSAFAQDLTNALQLGPASIAALSPNANSLRFTLAAATPGNLLGSFIAPGAIRNARTTFRGVIDAGSQTAVGQFPMGTARGSIVIEGR